MSRAVSDVHYRTASEFKIKRAQGDETAPFTGEAMRFAIGIDMASGTTDEAADRALSAVARKLDKTLSVEYTVNELITEASDPANLALMYIGACFSLFFQSFATHHTSCRLGAALVGVRRRWM